MRYEADVESLSQSVASNDFRCLEDFDFLATDLVGGEGGNKNGEGSMSVGSGIWTNLRLVTGVTAGTTGIGDRGAPSTIIEVFNKFSEKEVGFAEFVDVCTVDSVSLNFDFFSETRGAEAKFIFSVESRDESRFTFVSEKKFN